MLLNFEISGDDVELPKRKSIRLKQFDYSQNGYYFITICTYNRERLLGEFVGQGLCSCRFSEISLSMIGEIISSELLQLEKRYPTIKINKHIMMPNHIHAIIVLGNDKQQKTEKRQEQSPCPTIGDIICTFKSITTKQCNKNDNIQGRKIWQPRFHDHIIRNEQEYQQIWQYIDTNTMKWQDDCYYI